MTLPKSKQVFFYTLYSCFELKLQKKNNNNLLNKITELHSINITLLLRRPYQTVFVLCNSKHTLAWVGGRKNIYSSSKKKKSPPKFFLMQKKMVLFFSPQNIFYDCSMKSVLKHDRLRFLHRVYFLDSPV